MLKRMIPPFIAKNNAWTVLCTYKTSMHYDDTYDCLQPVSQANYNPDFVIFSARIIRPSLSVTVSR